MKFSTGTSIGTGWALKDVQGFALNSATKENPQPLHGVLVKPFLSAVSDNQSWIYENDQGENQYGWYALMSSYVGYDLPFSKSINGKFGITLDIKADISHRNESPMDLKNGWGSDFKKVLIGPIGIMEFSRGYSIIINLQWAKIKVFSDESQNNMFYKNQIYKNAKYTLLRSQVIIKKAF